MESLWFGAQSHSPNAIKHKYIISRQHVLRSSETSWKNSVMPVFEKNELICCWLCSGTHRLRKYRLQTKQTKQKTLPSNSCDFNLDEMNDHSLPGIISAIRHTNTIDLSGVRDNCACRLYIQIRAAGHISTNTAEACAFEDIHAAAYIAAIVVSIDNAINIAECHCVGQKSDLWGRAIKWWFAIDWTHHIERVDYIPKPTETTPLKRQRTHRWNGDGAQWSDHW